MDWCNERWVKLYVRDTSSWYRFGWEGQCLLMMLLRKVDRAGIMEGIEEPILDLKHFTGLPEDVLEKGLERLLKSGTIEINDNILVIPKFIEAQESTKTDAQRARESREKRRSFVVKKQTSKKDSTNKKTKQDPKEKPDYKEVARKYLNIFNAVFGRNIRATSMIIPKIENRLSDKNIKIWQIYCLPLLIRARDYHRDYSKLSPEVFLRDGKKPRTGHDGKTHGAYDWLSEVFLIADTIYLNEQLTIIAEHFELIEDIQRTGCQIYEKEPAND